MADLDPRIRVERALSLRRPMLIAAWPGMGLVGLKAVEFLKDSLAADPVASIETSDFFEMRGIAVHEGLLDTLTPPTSRFYAWKHPKTGPDLLLFLSEAQPVSGRELTLARLVAETALRFGVTQVLTAAALASQIDYMAPSRAWGASNDAALVEELRRLGVTLLKEGQIGGLNGVLLGVARQYNLPGMCLLGEIPYYATAIESPKASKVIVDLFAGMLGITIDTSPLVKRARRIEAQIEKLVRAAKSGGEQEEGSGEGQAPGGASIN